MSEFLIKIDFSTLWRVKSLAFSPLLCDILMFFFAGEKYDLIEGLFPHDLHLTRTFSLNKLWRLNYWIRFNLLNHFLENQFDLWFNHFDASSTPFIYRLIYWGCSKRKGLNNHKLQSMMNVEIIAVQFCCAGKKGEI